VCSKFKEYILNKLKKDGSLKTLCVYASLTFAMDLFKLRIYLLMERFPKEESPFCNPFKIGKDITRG